MGMTEITTELNDKFEESYIICAFTNPKLLTATVSLMRKLGWKLHGPLQLTSIADAGSVTFASIMYSQAMYRDLKPEEYIGDAKRDPLAKTPDD